MNSNSLRPLQILGVAFLCLTTSGAESFNFAVGHEQVRTRDFAGARAVYARALNDPAAAVRSIAQLNIALTYIREDNFADAKKAYENMPADAPAHHKWEAEQKFRALERRERGLPDRLASRTRIPEGFKADVSIHVAPTGSDTNSGTAQNPFATLERARDEIRARRKNQTNTCAFEVLVHGGEYSIQQTIKLNAQDSGAETSPIVYRAFQAEKPLLRGGIRLTGFERATAGSNWSRLPETSRGKVFRVNVKESGLEKLIPLELGGFASGRGFRTHSAHELFFNGKAMQLARGPNTGFLKIKDVVVKDGTKGYDRSGSKTGQFVYEGDAPGRWTNEPDLLLYGYWFWDWADSYERVASIDAKQKIIILKEPFHSYGYSIGAPFYAINALSELDQPGEWHLDRQSGELLIYPPGEIQSAEVELSVLPQRMLELENVAHVRFQGLTWELGSSDAIRVAGGKDVLFAGCTIRRFAGNGIEISGGAGHGILSCDIHSLGRGGTIVSGGNRRDLTPGRHFVENCEIYELSRIDHTYTPAVLLSGVGNRIAHNQMHDVLSSALRVGGNDHVIEFNEIFNAVRESDDQGGADMFGDATYRGNIFRFNHWHHIGNWDGKAEQPKCGQAGIRLDDAISGTLVYGNIFERCSAGKLGFGGVQIHGGKDNVIDNNLFIDCAAAISFSAWPEERWRNSIKEALSSNAIDRNLYLQRYPELAALQQNANQNHVWRNRAVNVGEFFRRAPRAVVSADNSSVPATESPSESPGFNRIPTEEIGLYSDGFREALWPGVERN